MKLSAALFLGLLALSAAAWSQKPAPADRKGTQVSAYKLIAVKVTGTQRYTDKEILSASGLQLGENVGEGDFKEAVARLGDTGLFRDIAYSYSYSAAGTKLEFQLEDAPQKNMVPVHFANFVWFTDAELMAGLQQRIPLFKKEVPVDGAYPDKISAALQEMLEERHLPGHVDYLRQGKQDGGDITGIAYRVLDVDIHIHAFEFPGAAPEQVSLLDAAVHRYIGADYDREALATIAHMDCLPVYLQRGYLKARFSAADASVTSSSDSEIKVDAILPVTPGKVYSTTDVAWKGNAAIAKEKLQGLIHLPAGQPADAVRLRSDLDTIDALYHNQGYMMEHVTPVPVLDDEKSTVHYDLNVVEGDQFKMGELELLGLDSQTKDRLQEAWNLPEGQPYNASYPKMFLDTKLRSLPGASRWKASVYEAVDEKDKTVDVTIKFTIQ